jgi:hypothetical protein
VPGVYILDVILQQGSKQLAYETILVVIDKPAAPEQYNNSIINNFKHHSVVNNFINKIKIENDVQTKNMTRNRGRRSIKTKAMS